MPRAFTRGSAATAPDQRVFLLTRSGYAGSQRYAAAIWSGDIASRWEDFKNQIPAGLNFSMSGIPYWTSDIGGFAVERRYEHPNATDQAEWRELQARWYQFGAFCPLFRVHGQFPYPRDFNIAPAGHAGLREHAVLRQAALPPDALPLLAGRAGATIQNATMMRGLDDGFWPPTRP